MRGNESGFMNGEVVLGLSGNRHGFDTAYGLTGPAEMTQYRRFRKPAVASKWSWVDAVIAAELMGLAHDQPSTR